MKLGFTGTQLGMAPPQLERLREYLLTFNQSIAEFHHGCCVGADAQAHLVFRRVFGRLRPIVGHPPSRKGLKYAGSVAYDCDQLRDDADYLSRNRRIVEECDFLIAAPFEYSERLRSGTWSTVRYARKCARSGVVIMPNGSLRTLAMQGIVNFP